MPFAEIDGQPETRNRPFVHFSDEEIRDLLAIDTIHKRPDIVAEAKLELKRRIAGEG